MKKEIPENFIGYLDLQGRGDGEYDCFYSIDGFRISILPKNNEAKQYISTILNTRRGSVALNKWVFGEIPLGGKVAFLINELLSNSFIPQDGILYFYTSIMLMGGSDANISTFEKIIFSGGIVEVIYPTEKAEKDLANLKAYEDYTKNFSICVENESIQVTLSVAVITSSSRNRIADRSKSYSYLSFGFSSPKHLDELEKYYTFARTIFSFLSFTRNILFDTSVRTTSTARDGYVSMQTKISDGFVDYSNDTVDSMMKIIDIEKLTPNISQLLEVLYHEYLLFLPNQNKDQNFIYHHNIVDVCSGLEREFKKLGNRLPATEQNILDDARSLHSGILDLIKNRACDDRVKVKASNLIVGLKNFQPSAKEKIMAIYTKFYGIMNFIANIGVNFPDDSFEREMSKFINLRNDVAHDKEIILDGKVSIYKHLVLLIYISVLHRANYDDESIKKILEYPFNYLRRSK